jgi:hypothetical protein
MTNIFLSLISFFVILYTDTPVNKSISIDIVDILYYSNSDCSEKSPVLVRVKFSVDETDLTDLKMVLKYPDGITMTMSIKEKDNQGNIVYSFCSKEDAIHQFSVYFSNSSGTKSNEINVKADLSQADIISSPPPLTTKIN